MDDQTSAYQSVKIWLSGYLPLDRDAVHVLIGLTLVLIAIFISRKSMRVGPFVWALAVACVLGIGMELMDMKDDIQTLGVWRWHASVLDVIRTISVPLLAFFVALHLKGKRSRGKASQ